MIIHRDSLNILSYLGSSTRNLPPYTKVSAAKLKLSAIGGLITLRLMVKKSYGLSLGIIVFLRPQNSTFWPMMTIFMNFHHFVVLIFFYNYKLRLEFFIQGYSTKLAVSVHHYISSSISVIYELVRCKIIRKMRKQQKQPIFGDTVQPHNIMISHWFQSR